MGTDRGEEDRRKILRNANRRVRQWAREYLDARHIATALVLTVLVTSLGALFGIGPVPRLPFRSEIPQPDLSAFLPEGDFRVVDELRVDLDGSGVEEVVLTATRVPSARWEPPATTVLVLGWDDRLKQWVRLFDGSTHSTEWEGEPVLPPELAADDLVVDTLAGPRAEVHLLVAANLRLMRPYHVVAILEVRSGLPRLVYSFRGTAEGTTSVVSRPEGDSVRIRSWWHTAVDPGCCPSREFEMEIAPIGEPAEPYRVVWDDRPWLGIWVVYDEAGNAIVAEVAPDGPAAHRVRPRDRLVGLADVTRGSEEAIHGPALVRDLALRQAGDQISLEIQRLGASQQVSVESVSRAMSSAPRSYPSIPDLGLELRPAPDGTITVSFRPDAPVETGDPPVFGRLVALEGQSFSTVADVYFRLLRVESGSVVTLVVEAASGEVRELVLRPVAPVISPAWFIAEL